MRDIFALPNLHNLVLARGHYRCMMPCSSLALSQSNRALYRQQIKAILGIVIIILVEMQGLLLLINCWNYMNIDKIYFIIDSNDYNAPKSIIFLCS